ncbi:MAG: glycerol-3-phosphate dehydrogenase [Pyrinomonadaceae bacterium]
MMQRRIPSDIESANFDAVIIGAGINGAGIARDAAMRGLKVLLLDKGDVASGTTSWSTRLIHGGLRYLEHGEIALVRESLRERERLFRLAPHLVRPLALLIPLYADGKRRPLTIRAGMIAYDALSFDKSLARHHMLSREETIERAQGINREGLRGAALYCDAQVEYAERLALENAMDARRHGAVILTYARADRFIIERGAVRGVEFTDLLEDAAYKTSASVIVNVAGPWVDEVLARLDGSGEQLIGGTKGSHIVVDSFKDAPEVALYTEALEDGRPFFIIPWNNQLLIGTTDQRYAGDLDCVEADEQEIDYLLRETNRIIPRARLMRASINFTYSGVRPLPFVREQVEKSITRRHFIRDHSPQLQNFFSIVGGKLTTYRNLSEQAVDMIFKKLSRRRTRSATARESLPGAATEDFTLFSDEFKKKSKLPLATTDHLLRVYGTRATEVLEMARESAELEEVFDDETGATGAEVLFSFRREMAQTLKDCLLRRTMVGLNRNAGIGADEAAASIAQKYLGWTEERAAREIEEYRKYIERFHPRELSMNGLSDRQTAKRGP